MKNVMILAGGTATAWHIAEVLQKYYRDEICLTICDINERYLVHSSIFADNYLRVPPIKSANYYETMLRKISEYQIDILIPLIDEDISLFSCDNPDLLSLRVHSTAARQTTFQALSNKRNLVRTLAEIGVETPQTIFDLRDLEPTSTYFVKNAIGCGSRGAARLSGAEIQKLRGGNDQIIQEICTGPEITVDAVMNGNAVHTVCRERIETKLGVSTKCRVYCDKGIQSIIQNIADNIALPDIFCLQFMKNADGNWTLIDFNLRSGGGTAISAAVGFEAVRFAAAGWLHKERDPAWISQLDRERFVVRTYSEIVTV